MRTLLASLGDHSLAMLRGIAELRGVELVSNARIEVATQLAAVLADTETTRSALDACSPAARAAWAALVAAGGRVKAVAFTRLNGEIRPVGPGRLEREATWLRPEGPTEELWYRGLIFRAFADFGEGPLEYIYVPEDLPVPPGYSQQAPAPQAQPALSPLPAPAKAASMLNRMAVDACTLLAAARETPLVVDKAHIPQASEAEGVRLRLSLADPVRFDLLLLLARTHGWLAPDRGRLAVDHRATGAWLRANHWHQMTVLFTGWRDSADWNDLRRTPTLRAEGEWRNDPLLARRGVLNVLHTLTPGAWYALSDLAAHLKTTNPDFQRPDGDYTGWYLKNAVTDRYLSGFEAWDEVEGRLIRFLVTGPLFWLGAVALDAPSGGAAAFRLTAAGAAWLAGTVPSTLPRPARLSVGDDFIVTAPLLCPLLDRFRLLRFTEPLAADGHPHQTDTVTRHRITRGSLTRASASGLKPEAATEFLRRAAGGRLPPKVITALERFARLGGTVRISRGAVLRVADASTLAALRGDPAIAPLLGDLISAQAVLVREANLPRLLSVIKDSGYDISVD